MTSLICSFVCCGFVIDYHIDRLGDPPIHNWHDIVLFGMQTLGPMDSSLTHTLKVFLSHHGQQRERVK